MTEDKAHNPNDLGDEAHNRMQEDKCNAIWKTGIQTPMAQGRSTKTILVIKWIRTSRLSIKNSLSAGGVQGAVGLGARPSNPQNGTKSSFWDPRFVLEFARIRRPAVQIWSRNDLDLMRQEEFRVLFGTVG